MIVKNYKHVFLTASELRQNCGIKLNIFKINLIKNNNIALNLELLNVRIYKERKKEAWGRKCSSIMKNKLSILKKYEKHTIHKTTVLPASFFQLLTLSH